MGNALSKTDSGFGPLLAGKGYFTLLFEDSVFTTAPAIIAILATLIQWYTIVGGPKLVRADPLLLVKLLLGALLTGCSIAMVIFWATMPAISTKMTIPAAGLSVAASVCITVFLFTEHLYSYRLSTFLSLFMSITLLLGIAKTYSCFKRVGAGPAFSVYVLDCVTRFVLLISQEVSKRRLIRQETLKSDVGSEAASGFWTRALFLWLNSTLLLGFRKALSVDDLPALAPEFRAKTLFEAFKPQWERVDKKSKYALIKACLSAQAVPFITITLPRLCLIGFTFAQPFLLLRTTSAIREEDLPEQTTYGLIGATALIYFGIAVTKGYSTHLAYQVTTCIRGMLTVAIYDKMLRLSHQVLAESAAVTLMSTDLAGLERLVPLFHDMRAAVIELGLGLTILARIAGPSCILFLVPGIITAGGSSLVMKKMVVARTAWNEKIQDRVAKTSNVIAQLKAIKMAGLSEPVLGFIERLRTVELDTSMPERYLRIAVGALNAFNRAVVPVIVLAGALFWTGVGTGLRPGEIYTILAVVAIVSQPLATLLLAIPAITSAMASFPRVQKFLCENEQVDNRSNISDSRVAIRAAGVTVDSDVARLIFQGINLQIMQGTVVMLTGPVGCGKTTLLKSLIGEVRLQSGSVQVAQSCPVGYSDQVAWLENITIRENICHEDYNAVWYKEVLAACALETDLAALPAGDQTVVGANSSNLSGGQKQRVALARAVYCQAPLLVLDDPLSAVDATTSSIIAQRLFGEKGLLRKRNATVLMTTNSGDLCSAADLVFTMDMEGNIGRLENLSRGTKPQPDVQGYSNTRQEDQEGLDEKAGASTDTFTAPPAARTACVDTTDDMRKGDISLYSYYIGSVRPSLVVLSLGLIALSSISDRLPAIFIRVWLDVDPDNKLFFIGYAGLGVFKVVAASISLYFFFKNVVTSSSNVLHKRLLNALMGTTLSYLNETDPGSILSRFSRDMSMVAQSMAIYFLNSFYMIVTITMETAIICSGARYTASMIPALLIVVYLVQHFYLRTSRQLRIRELETQEPLFTKFTETSNGIQHIRAFKWQGAFMQQMQELFDHTQIPYYNLFCVQRWLTLVLDLTVTAIATMVVGLAIGYPSLTDENAVGLAMLSIVTFSDSLAGLVNAWVELEISLGSIARIKAFCFGTPQEKEEDSGNSGNVPDHWPSSGRVEFRSVCASYKKLDGTAHQVLSNVSFTVDDGQKLGLSGRTGSGKSSVLAVLLRMIDYTGSILIDDRELRTIPRQLLRSRLITLAQDGLQLQGTIRLNLDPYNLADSAPDDDNGSHRRLSDEALIQALTRVGLWDSVQQCGGLDTEMAAASFSQGQIQLLGIARALLRKPYQLSKIVLVDEATSSVDNDTDKAMQAVFSEAFANCTVFMISHRRDGLDGMDRVITLKGGQVEEG